MKPTTLFQRLGDTVRASDPVYQRTREREPALAAYPTASILLHALSPRSRLDSQARQRLLRVIVLEYQQGRHPLWCALAMRALEPMLAGLRARVRRLAEDEREQVLHTAVVDAMGRLRLGRAAGPTFPLLTLRRAIDRALIAAERAQHRLTGEVPLDECAPECGAAWHDDPPQFVQCLAREIGELIVRRPGGHDAVRVLAGAETLGEQVERLSCADVSYDCLRKRHQRLLDGVRRELSGGRP